MLAISKKTRVGTGVLIVCLWHGINKDLKYQKCPQYCLNACNSCYSLKVKCHPPPTSQDLVFESLVSSLWHYFKRLWNLWAEIMVDRVGSLGMSL